MINNNYNARLFNTSKQLQIRSELNKEFHLRYREYVESVFAINLMKNPRLFPVLEKVSSHILEFIRANKSEVKKLIENDRLIRDDLFNTNLYGALPLERDSDKLLDTFATILKNPDADLNNKMIINFIFMRYIFPALHPSGNINKETIAAITFMRDRPRQDRNDVTIKSNDHLGITKNKTFQNMIKDTASMRIRPVDRCIPRKSSAYFKQNSTSEIPFVAGPSGHTAVLVGGVVSYCGVTDMEEIMQYTAACFAHLVSGGCHNFHEIYSVANQLCNVPYDIRNYKFSLSESVLDSDIYKKICDQFPHYFEHKSDVSCKNN